MHLRSARLCLDCEEVHDAQQCPACASETFAYITRWVPVPDRPHGPERPQTRTPPPAAQSMETLGAYREMLHPEGNTGGKWRTLKRGAVGLALFGLAGWMWRSTQPDAEAEKPSDGVSNERQP